MGLAQDTRQAVSRYHDEVDALAQAADDLARAVQDCRHRLEADGRLGRSTDRQLERARARLGAAEQQLRQAVEEARASSGVCQEYVDRAFPL
jgi:uncharacterized protein YukE